MRRLGVMRTLLLLTVTVLLVFATIGCTKYASEEDLQNLETSKQAALSAESKVDELNSEKAELIQLKADKEAELQAVQAEKSKVEERSAANACDCGDANCTECAEKATCDCGEADCKVCSEKEAATDGGEEG
jgi:hypothetical protein